MSGGTNHEYTVRLEWEGNRGSGTSGYTGYERRFRIAVAGKADLIGSADAAFLGEPHLHNPEELLLAAVTSCHMLTYLALCARNGVAVLRYADSACASLTVLPGGGGRFERITLRPCVVVARENATAAALALHAEAHAMCFVASSCNFPIRCEAEVQTGGVRG